MDPCQEKDRWTLANQTKLPSPERPHRGQGGAGVLRLVGVSGRPHTCLPEVRSAAGGHPRHCDPTPRRRALLLSLWQRHSLPGSARQPGVFLTVGGGGHR